MVQEIEQQTQPTNTALSLIMQVNVPAAKKEMSAITSFQQMVKGTMVRDQDYGVIPGTQKPTLLKPGAEKLLMLLGLQSEYSIVNKVEDWDAGFFAYTVRATLTHNGEVITQGLGAANTKETRYQLKHYNNETHKKEWDGETYQDPFTLQNTVLKMAKKRAQVDAALTVGSLSNIFTQDVEDLQSFTRQEHQAAATTTVNAADVKITFGAHKGKTLGELAQEKDGLSYIKWMSDKSRYEDQKSAAAAFLQQHSGAPASNQTPSPAQQAAPQQPSAQPTPPQGRPYDGDVASLFSQEPDLPF